MELTENNLISLKIQNFVDRRTHLGLDHIPIQIT